MLVYLTESKPKSLDIYSDYFSYEYIIAKPFIIISPLSLNKGKITLLKKYIGIRTL